MTNAPYYVRFETQLGCSGVSATPLFTLLPSTDTSATFSPIGGVVGTEIEFRGPTAFGFGTVVYMQLQNSQFELLSRPHLLDNGGVRAGLCVRACVGYIIIIFNLKINEKKNYLLS